MFGRSKQKGVPEYGPDQPAVTESLDTGQDDDLDIRGGPADANADQDPGGFFDHSDLAAGPAAAAAGPAYPDPDERFDGDDGGDDGDDIAASMAWADSGVPRKAEKAPKEPRKRSVFAVDRDGGGDDRLGKPVNEAARQAVFSCGCVMAGFCGILLVLFGTVFVCRTLNMQPQPVLAKPTSDNVYYDAGGRKHVNVYLSREPDTEITVYVLPDGSVTTEKPERQDEVRIVTMYVDENGNVSSEPPVRTPDPVPEPEPEPADPVPDSQVLYLDGDGQLVGDKPAEGPWRPVTVLVTRDGQVSVIPGEMQGVEPDEPEEPAAIPPVVLYILDDGTVTTTAPGGAGRKFTVDLNGDSPVVTQEPAAAPEPEPEPDDPYAGMNEEEILREAASRRAAGKGWYLDTDGIYVIRRGDTLGELSGKLGFSVDFLAAYNGIEDKNLIITGESLRYPAA